MNRIFFLLLIAVNQLIMAQSNTNFYDFKMETLDGKELDFATLKGKKVLIVNVASACGFTPQYETLQELHIEYGDKCLVIIGFPANNFGAQEPGTNEEIRSFCSKNYGVTFQMMAKISVTGENLSPLYAWLTKKSLNGVSDSEVSWNFQKFLIGEDGKWQGVVSPQESPACDRIINWITAL
jgi:glutathione peroxidase